MATLLWIVLPHMAYAQVNNGDFSSAGTGWTLSAGGSGSGSVTYPGNQARIVGDNTGGASPGASDTLIFQTFSTQGGGSEAGTLTLDLVSYTSTDVGNWDYPVVSIDGTVFGISPAGALVASGSGINNANQTGASVTRLLAAGTYNLGVGVHSLDGIFGPGVATFDNIVFHELTLSPGAQTTNENTPLSFGSSIQVDTNTGEPGLAVTLTVTDGILQLGTTAGITIDSGANNSSTVTISGTDAAINNALNGLTYVPNTNFDGSASLTFIADVATISDTDIVPITVNNTHAYTISKTVDQTTVSTLPATLAYTVTLVNTGGADFTGVAVTDILSQNGTGTNLPVTGPSGDANSNNQFDVGETWVYTATWPVTQANMDSGADLVNVASATTDQLPTAQTSQAVTNILQTAAVDLAKSANVASVSVIGDAIVYSLLITNTGNVTGNGLSVSDGLGSVTCPTSGNNTIATLAPGASETCTLNYNATLTDFNTNGGGDGDIDNTASVSGTAGGGLTPVSDSDNASVALVLSPALTIVKTASPSANVSAGTNITYTYLVTNTGNVSMSGVSISDIHNGTGTAPVPGSEALDNDVAPLGDTTDAGTDGVWDNLAPGDSIVFTANYTVTQSDIDSLQ